MGLFDFIGGIFKPASDIVDRLATTEKDKLELRNALAKINADVTTKLAEYEMKVIELQAQVIQAASNTAVAEAKSESWFVRNYKPMIITSMFLMIVSESFGLLKTELPEIFWQIFAGAFGVLTAGPSITKGAGKIIDSVKGIFTKK